MPKIRSPIIAMLGHVDHGKTTLLDKIRGTAIVKGEPGLITQHISASYVPIQIVQKISGNLLSQLKSKLVIPGLLWIDSPGHAAFTTLRKRGGAIADMAILVIDVLEGFKPQTDESLQFLKQFKTPFIVAATKIDKILGWSQKEGMTFSASLAEQNKGAQDELEKKIYQIVGHLSEKGFDADRYDRVSDFAKRIAIVPVSGVSGEGIPDLLMILAGISQRYLKKGLKIIPGTGKGTVLDVKEFKGLGLTIDVILYDGEIKVGDWIVIGGKEPTITNVKALLQPAPLSELRLGKTFSHVNLVTAAAGIKIAAPGLDNIIAGSPLRAVRSKLDLERIKKEVMEEVEEVEIKTDREGAILKADTLGSLEALIKSLKELVPVRKAEVGNLTKADIMEIRPLKNKLVFAFGVKISPEITKLAKDNEIRVFSSDVIYSLLESYEKWEKESKRRSEAEMLKTVTRPARFKVLPRFVFRQKKPAIFGVEILAGTIKSGYKIVKNSTIVGQIKQIQEKGKNLEEAKIGDKIAISVPEIIMGKHVKVGDILQTYLTAKDIENLNKLRAKLREDEVELLEDLQKS